MSHLPSLPSGSLIDIFARSPELFEPLHAFGEAVMRGASPFLPGERELMAAFVSRLNGCRFCELAHATAAAHFGEDAGLVARLVEDVETSGIAEPLRPVFRYLRTLTLTPADTAAEEVRAMLDAGWGEEAVENANLVCGYFSLMNRLVEGLGLEADAGMIAMAGRQLHDRGYAGIARMARSMRRSA